MKWINDIIMLNSNVYMFMLDINARSIGKINIVPKEKKDNRDNHSFMNILSGNIKYKFFR